MESPLLLAGRFINDFAQLIQVYVAYIFYAIIAFVVLALLLRLVVEALQLSPFGRFAYYGTRPANEMLRNMRQSRFYFPLKRAFGFDPAIIMLLIATAILCYVANTVITYLITVLFGLGNALIAFSQGQPFTGARYLIGALLLAAVFYLMALMTIAFIHWLFGLLTRAAYRALERIGPLLSLFEFRGILAGWSFLILWITLSVAALAIQIIFLSGPRVV